MESPGAAGAHQQFCLKWNSFGSNLAASFAHLFRSETLADVTLFCDGVSFRAHKLILAACSKHLADLFETAAPLLHQNHLLVILDGTSAANMAALLEFMYKGEVHVSQDSLSSFLKAAECLQVKGLSIEHEKLAVAQSHNNVMEPNGAPPSPSSRSSANTPLPANKPIKMEADMPPQSPTYSCPPGASIAQYMHHYSRQYEQQHHQAQQQHQQQQQQQQQAAAQQQQQQQQQQAAQQQHQQAAQQQAVAQHNQAQQRRNMRSPTMQERPSVLRDCSKTVGSSRPASPGPGPLSLAYRPSSSASSIPSSDAEVAADSSRFDPDQAPTSLVCPPDSAERRTQDPGCPEDLRMKMEPPSMMVAEPPSSTASSNNLNNSVASNGSLASSMSSIYDMDEKSKKDRTDLIPTTLWNSVTSKLSKTGAITTPDGKKLKCPFCERLYGYETNLRAHIRQRHQGIRVPCPFCSRTFTRNNTVRRHIAREHKTELSLKAFQQVHTP